MPRIQDILRETLPGSAPQAVPKQKTAQRKSALVKNSEAPSSSFCDSSTAQQRYYRSSKTNNAAAQANIQTETGPSELPPFVGGGGGNIIETDADKSLKPSERLEACINSMMKKAEMLHPSPEEQILQKQQILEELQRVERELQEKAHAQLLLTAQHQQHHHQGIQIGTIVTGTPTISTLTNNNNSNQNNANSLSNLATVAGVHAQQLIFNTDAVLDIESLSSLTDISSVSNHMGLNLHLTTSANNLAFPPAVHSPQQLYNLSQQQQQQPPQQQVQKVVQQSVITTTTPAADYCKSRMGKLAKQAKTVMKQNSQQPFKIPPPILLHQNDSSASSNKVDPQTVPVMEESEKMNLRSVVYSEQQHPQNHLQQQQQTTQQQQQQQQQIQLQQQLLHQHSQQQFVLSEFTQNLTLRNTKYCEGAIAGVLHAMGGIKLTESTQTHAIPMYDAVTVGNALKQQQPHLIQPQQLQIIPQEQQQQQPSPQSLPLQPLPPQPQHFEKNVKLVKGKTNKVQQQSLLHTNPMSMQQQSQQQAIKQQLSSCNETCTTLVGSIPLDGTSVLTLSGMASPAFPVSIAVTPVSIPTTVSLATHCGAFTHNLALDEGLMVAAPARTLHETLGEIMTGTLMFFVDCCDVFF